MLDVYFLMGPINYCKFMYYKYTPARIMRNVVVIVESSSSGFAIVRFLMRVGERNNYVSVKFISRGLFVCVSEEYLSEVHQTILLSRKLRTGCRFIIPFPILTL